MIINNKIETLSQQENELSKKVEDRKNTKI